MNKICRSVQKACVNLKNFFIERGLEISGNKSEVVVFSRKKSNPLY
jgi:hypothetical protein